MVCFSSKFVLEGKREDRLNCHNVLTASAATSLFFMSFFEEYWAVPLVEHGFDILYYTMNILCVRIFSYVFGNSCRADS